MAFPTRKVEIIKAEAKALGLFALAIPSDGGGSWGVKMFLSTSVDHRRTRYDDDYIRWFKTTRDALQWLDGYKVSQQHKGER